MNKHHLLYLSLALLASPSSAVFAQAVKIVGIGAGTCAQFSAEIRGDAQTEKNYFAWAQGHMTGLLLRAPPGKDEIVDLAPPRFGLYAQASFLREYCAARPEKDFVDAVHELYRTLRAPAG